MISQSLETDAFGKTPFEIVESSEYSVSKKMLIEFCARNFSALACPFALFDKNSITNLFSHNNQLSLNSVLILRNLLCKAETLTHLT